MDFNEYQRSTRETANYSKNKLYGNNSIVNLMYAALGLNGEAGEVADQVKKMFRNDDGAMTAERIQKLFYELGDTLWYVAAVAHEAGFDLDDVAVGNLEKLRKRYEDHPEWK